MGPLAAAGSSLGSPVARAWEVNTVVPDSMGRALQGWWGGEGGGHGGKEETILSIDKYHLMSNEHDELYFANDPAFLLSMNDSNSTNITFLVNYTLNIKTHINRYRKKPDHCHNFYENEREYLPCHNSRASNINSSKFACIFQLYFIIFIFYSNFTT
jgi:hypothetical protein